MKHNIFFFRCLHKVFLFCFRVALPRRLCHSPSMYFSITRIEASESQNKKNIYVYLTLVKWIHALCWKKRKIQVRGKRRLWGQMWWRVAVWRRGKHQSISCWCFPPAHDEYRISIQSEWWGKQLIPVGAEAVPCNKMKSNTDIIINIIIPHACQDSQRSCGKYGTQEMHYLISSLILVKEIYSERMQLYILFFFI